MNDTTSSPSLKYFDAETLKDLRENSRSYQKLDLTYLAAAGAIVTILNLHDDSLLEFGARQWAVVVAFLILLVTDTIIEQFFFSEWLAAKTNATKRCAISIVKHVASIQPLLHLFFIIGVISFTLGVAKGATDYRESLIAKANIQDATEVFLSKNKRLPNSIDELIASIPSISTWHEKLGYQAIQFDMDSKERYEIVFSGQDKEFDTDDDDIINSEVKLRKLLNDVQNNACR